jgi:phosphoserine phosphatase RsbU/P
VTEAANASGEEFGEQRMIDAARQSSSESAADFNQRLLTRVKAFCSGQPQDDATLVLIRMLEVSPASPKLQVTAVTSVDG